MRIGLHAPLAIIFAIIFAEQYGAGPRLLSTDQSDPESLEPSFHDGFFVRGFL